MDILYRTVEREGVSSVFDIEGGGKMIICLYLWILKALNFVVNNIIDRFWGWGC